MMGCMEWTFTVFLLGGVADGTTTVLLAGGRVNRVVRGSR